MLKAMTVAVGAFFLVGAAWNVHWIAGVFVAIVTAELVRFWFID